MNQRKGNLLRFAFKTGFKTVAAGRSIRTCKGGGMKNLVNRFARVFICGICWLLIACFSAHAESNGGQEWEFQLTLYGWLAGQNGTVATLPGLPPTDIDVDFYDDILGNINFALFLVGEAHKGRWGGLLDIAYTDIEDENALPNGIFWSSADSRTKSWMVSAAGLYRLVEKQRAFVDAVGGIRYWNVDSELSLAAALLPTRKISNSEDWIDPIVGLKGLSFLWDSKFFVSGGLVFGGFNIGSDFMWDAWANLGYLWTQNLATTIGYRYLDVDYEKGDFLYDVAQDGLLLGLSWRF